MASYQYSYVMKDLSKTFAGGGEVLKGFSLALLVGIGVGTYSSIFVASPIVVALRDKYAPARRMVTASA